MTKPCPTCGRGLDGQRSNSGETTTLAFPTALMASLEHALSIAGTTAMMCGEKEARAVYDRIRESVAAQVPPQAVHFHEGSWTAFVLRARDGLPVSVSTRREPGWSGGWKVALTDESGTAWPRGAYREEHVTLSERLADKDEAERLAAEIRHLVERFTPMTE